MARPGTFQKGNKFGKGGLKDPPGGRPTLQEQAKKESFKEALERLREEKALELAQAYYEMADGTKPETVTMRHLVDSVIPRSVDAASNPPAFPVAFIQFNHNTLQLHSEAVPTTVLAANGNDGQERADGVAPEEREGQDGPKFLDFKDVPGKRR